jgi:hypothetical protein
VIFPRIFPECCNPPLKIARFLEVKPSFNEHSCFHVIYSTVLYCAVHKNVQINVPELYCHSLKGQEREMPFLPFHPTRVYTIQLALPFGVMWITNRT